LRKTPLVLVVLVWMTRVFFPDAAPAQNSSASQSDETQGVRLSLGSASGGPGESVTVPVYMTPDADVRVGSLKIGITFVSVNLKFDDVEPGISAEVGEVELAHDLKVIQDSGEVETSTLTLEASVPESATEGIPSGLLAYIQMRLDEGARPAVITLRTSAEAIEAGTDRQLPVVLSSSDAVVEVFAPGSEPAVACFFFAH
jgi:hypothetical protein